MVPRSSGMKTLLDDIGGIDKKLAGDDGFLKFIAKWNGNMIRGNGGAEVKLADFLFLALISLGRFHESR